MRAVHAVHVFWSSNFLAAEIYIMGRKDQSIEIYLLKVAMKSFQSKKRFKKILNFKKWFSVYLQFMGRHIQKKLF